MTTHADVVNSLTLVVQDKEAEIAALRERNVKLIEERDGFKYDAGKYWNALRSDHKKLLSEWKTECAGLEENLRDARTARKMARNRVEDLETSRKDANARADAAEERVRDYEDAQRAAMDEACTADEKHCTCVPLLRERVRVLEALLRGKVRFALVAPIDDWKGTLERKALDAIRAALEGKGDG